MNTFQSLTTQFNWRVAKTTAIQYRPLSSLGLNGSHDCVPWLKMRHLFRKPLFQKAVSVWTEDQNGETKTYICERGLQLSMSSFQSADETGVCGPSADWGVGGTIKGANTYYLFVLEPVLLSLNLAAMQLQHSGVGATYICVCVHCMCVF